MPVSESRIGSLGRSEAASLCVLGLGYIGLPTAVLFARAGLRVHGVDSNPGVVEQLGKGQAHIIEPGLDAALSAAITSGCLDVTTVAQESEAFIIAVPTPFREGHVPDLRFVEAAANSIADVLQPGNLVILESTSPVGTTEKVRSILSKRRPSLRFAGNNEKGAAEPVYLAHCPERVLPGNILKELVENERVIGGIDQRSAFLAKQLYSKVSRGRMHLTSARTAELTKLAENAFRDVNIAFANELSTVAERLGVDVWELIKLANLHPRVDILRPGPGVGGHCIAVDPWFIIHAAPEESRLIGLAREINEARPVQVVDKVRRAIADNHYDKSTVISCLGLTYKADTDDLRESPAIEVVRLLREEQLGEILVTDPYVSRLPQAIEAQVRLVDCSMAIEKADILLLLVDHDQYRNISAEAVKQKVIVDTRGLWNRTFNAGAGA